MMKRLTIFSMLLVVISLTGCGAMEKDAEAQREANYQYWKVWHESCTKQWSDFECRLLYSTNDNADKARLLEGFREDRAFRNKDKK